MLTGRDVTPAGTPGVPFRRRAAAQRTRKIKLPIHGNLPPPHKPPRLAEELAMMDCITVGVACAAAVARKQDDRGRACGEMRVGPQRHGLHP